jgi:outer membrane protein assembly factor BamB
MVASNSAGTNRVADVVPPSPPFETRWKKSVGRRVQPASPLLAGGTVYVATETGDGGQRLVGYALDDGRSEARIDFDDEPISWSVADRRLYALSGETITAIDLRTGRRQWTDEPVGMERQYDRRKLLADGESVYAAGCATRVGSTGIHVFRATGGDPPFSGLRDSGVDIAEDSGYVSSLVSRRDRGYVTVIDQYGDGDRDGADRIDPRTRLIATAGPSEDWQAEIEYGAGDLAVGTDRVFVAAINAHSTSPTAVEAFEVDTGVRSWRAEIPAPAIGTALADGTLFVGLDGAGLIALDATSGEVVWEEYDRETTSAPTIAGDALYVGWTERATDVLAAVDPADGSERWRHDVGITLLDAPIVTDGAILIAGDDELRCLEGTSAPDAGAVDERSGDAVATCPNCGVETAPEANFCANCGTDLAAAACPTCDATLDGDESFCPACGEPLE